MSTPRKVVQKVSVVLAAAGCTLLLSTQQDQYVGVSAVLMVPGGGGAGAGAVGALPAHLPVTDDGPGLNFSPREREEQQKFTFWLTQDPNQNGNSAWSLLPQTMQEELTTLEGQADTRLANGEEQLIPAAKSASLSNQSRENDRLRITPEDGLPIPGAPVRAHVYKSFGAHHTRNQLRLSGGNGPMPESMVAHIKKLALHSVFSSISNDNTTGLMGAFLSSLKRKFQPIAQLKTVDQFLAEEVAAAGGDEQPQPGAGGAGAGAGAASSSWMPAPAAAGAAGAGAGFHPPPRARTRVPERFRLPNQPGAAGGARTLELVGFSPVEKRPVYKPRGDENYVDLTELTTQLENAYRNAASPTPPATTFDRFVALRREHFKMQVEVVNNLYYQTTEAFKASLPSTRRRRVSKVVITLAPKAELMEKAQLLLPEFQYLHFHSAGVELGTWVAYENANQNPMFESSSNALLRGADGEDNNYDIVVGSSGYRLRSIRADKHFDGSAIALANAGEFLQALSPADRHRLQNEIAHGAKRQFNTVFPPNVIQNLVNSEFDYTFVQFQQADPSRTRAARLTWKQVREQLDEELVGGEMAACMSCMDDLPKGQMFKLCDVDGGCYACDGCLARFGGALSQMARRDAFRTYQEGGGLTHMFCQHTQRYQDMGPDATKWAAREDQLQALTVKLQNNFKAKLQSVQDLAQLLELVFGDLDTVYGDAAGDELRTTWILSAFDFEASAKAILAAQPSGAAGMRAVVEQKCKSDPAWRLEGKSEEEVKAIVQEKGAFIAMHLNPPAHHSLDDRAIRGFLRKVKAPYVGVLMNCAGQGGECDNFLLKNEDGYTIQEVPGMGRVRKWTCQKCKHQNQAPIRKSYEDLVEEAASANQYLRDTGFIAHCYHDGIGFPTRRVCPQCWLGADQQVTYCEHDGGCKHWPSDHSAHQHVMCYGCLRPWGGAGGCSHGNATCQANKKHIQKLTVTRNADGSSTTGFEYLPEGQP